MGIKRDEYRTVFQDVSVDKNFVAGSSASEDPLIAGKAGYTIFVQKITVAITTSAAQSLTFQDNATTPIVIAVIPNSASVGSHEFEFGKKGVGLTVGKDLDLVASAAGPAGQIHVQAYLRLIGPVTPANL